MCSISTVHFILTKLQFAFLCQSTTPKSVTDIFNRLFDILGPDNSLFRCQIMIQKPERCLCVQSRIHQAYHPQRCWPIAFMMNHINSYNRTALRLAETTFQNMYRPVFYAVNDFHYLPGCNSLQVCIWTLYLMGLLYTIDSSLYNEHSPLGQSP